MKVFTILFFIEIDCDLITSMANSNESVEPCPPDLTTVNYNISQVNYDLINSAEVLTIMKIIKMKLKRLIFKIINKLIKIDKIFIHSLRLQKVDTIKCTQKSQKETANPMKIKCNWSQRRDN